MITSTQTYSLRKLKAAAAVAAARTGSYWAPFNHGELATIIYREAGERGWTLTAPAMFLSPTGGESVAAWRIAELCGRGALSSVALGWANSNTQRTALTLYGGYWTAAGIGVPFQRYRLRRHTHGADVPTEVRLALGQMAQDLKTWPDLIKELAGRTLAAGESERILAEAARSKLIPWSRVGKVDTLLRNGDTPTTALGLLLAFADITRLAPPLTQMAMVCKFVTQLKEFCHAETVPT